MFQAKVYVDRRDRLRNLMKTGLVLFLGNNEAPMNYTNNTYKFRQDSSFLYFFGLQRPALAGIIDLDNGTESIFGDEYEIEDIIWMGDVPTLADSANQVGIHSVFSLRQLSKVLASAIRSGRKIHFIPPYRGHNKIFLSSLLGICTSQLPIYRSEQLIKAIVELRSSKDVFEIEEMEKACDIGYKMHVTAMKMCKPGVKEHEIAGAIEGIALGHNGQVSFPIILSQNSHILHNHNHNATLEAGRLMITDAGAETSMNYSSDFTRTIPVSGKFTQKQKEIYEIVLAANNNSHKISRPGISFFDVHIEASKIIASGLKDLGIMKGDINEAVNSGAHALFFAHGLGHMIGLDVHDMEDLGENYVGYDDKVERSTLFGTAYLRMGRELKQNFVVTVEPGIYFIPKLIEKWKKENINSHFINFDKAEQYLDFGGIRLEDNLLITAKGNRIMGKRVPITVEEVEKTMNS